MGEKTKEGKRGGKRERERGEGGRGRRKGKVKWKTGKREG